MMTNSQKEIRAALINLRELIIVRVARLEKRVQELEERTSPVAPNATNL